MFEGYPYGLIDQEQVVYMCDEAQLPNVNTATGSINGLYTGLGNVDYPHTKVFTELQLGFMLDANLTVLKFLNAWYESIFHTTGGRNENRVVRLNYKDDYAGNIMITKTEIGPNSTTQRRPITYVLEKAYPYAIDAVPLQFGSSQITKVTAQFKYQRHYTLNSDVSDVKDNALRPSPVTRAAEPTQTAADQEQAAEQPRNPANSEPVNTNGQGTEFLPTDSSTGYRGEGNPDGELLYPNGTPVYRPDGTIRNSQFDPF